jgi:Sulfotransferase domain
MKLFLHIGPHKTGSTYIQKFFFDNRDHLRSLGVNYPNVGFIGQYGQHEAVKKIKTLGQQELDEYMAQLIGSEINFVSSENFDRLTSEDIQKLGKSLSNLDVRVVYYHRNYIDLLPSWWQEKVKHGSLTSFYEFVLPHILQPFASKIVNPGMILDLYANVFGKDNITIIDYDLALQKENILRPLLELLGIEWGIVKNEIVNPSLKVEIVEIIRALNIISDFHDQWSSHNVRASFLRKRKAEIIGSDVEHLAGVIREHTKSLKLTGKFFEESVSATFKKKYESCLLNKPFGAFPDREVRVPSDSWMLTGDAIAVCERIYQHIMASPP